MGSPQTLSEADRRIVAAWAAQAACLAAPDRADAVSAEIRWQLDHLPTEVGVALRTLPPVGQNASGPLGPGLLATGRVGEIVHEVQTSLGASGCGDRTDGHSRR